MPEYVETFRPCTYYKDKYAELATTRYPAGLRRID